MKIIGPEELDQVRIKYQKISIFLQRSLEICLTREQAGYRDARLPVETRWEMKSDRTTLLLEALQTLGFKVDAVAEKGGAEFDVAWGYNFPVFQQAIL